jgi:hypothetical protein
VEHGTRDLGELAIHAVALASRLTRSQRYVLMVAMVGKQRWHLRPPSKRTISALCGQRLLEPEPPGERPPDEGGLRPTCLGRIVAYVLFGDRVGDAHTIALSLLTQPLGGGRNCRTPVSSLPSPGTA